MPPSHVCSSCFLKLEISTKATEAMSGVGREDKGDLADDKNSENEDDDDMKIQKRLTSDINAACDPTKRDPLHAHAEEYVVGADAPAEHFTLQKMFVKNSWNPHKSYTSIHCWTFLTRHF